MVYNKCSWYKVALETAHSEMQFLLHIVKLFSYYILYIPSKQSVCQKCSVDTTYPGHHQQSSSSSSSSGLHSYLCKLCSERREAYKKSGAWFYKVLFFFLLFLSSKIIIIFKNRCTIIMTFISLSLFMHFIFMHTQ